MRFQSTYRAAFDANRTVIKLAREIQNLLDKGKITDALALEPKFDQADKRSQALDRMATTMRKHESYRPILNRKNFAALSPQKRMSFVKAGGKVID